MNKIYIFILLFLAVLSARAQILDDSTHLKYGSFSTKYYTDDYFIEDSIILKSIDSSFLNQHEYGSFYNDYTFYQNLGNTITPAFSLHFNPDNNVLFNLGNNRYVFYRFNDKKYYNTLSPHTFLKYAQGTKGDQILEGFYSQNINANWNLGGEFYRGVSRKQYATQQGNDKLSSTWNVRGYTSYLSKNKRYHFLGDIETQRVNMNEQWGMIFDNFSDSSIDLTINDGEFALNNYNARNEQKYRSVTIKQRYDIIKGYVGIYSKHGYRRDKWMYIDDNVKVDYNTVLDTSISSGDTIIANDTIGYTPEFYLMAQHSTDTTYDEKLFDSFENEVGIYIKSNLWRITFGYLQQWYGYENNYQATKIYGIENVLKGEFNYRFIDKLNVNISTQNSASGPFNTLAKIESKFGDISYRKSLSRPYMQHNYLNSNHVFWDNEFKNINSDEYRLMLKYRSDRFFAKTENSYFNINNYIYYDSTLLPKQEFGTINMFQSNNILGVTLGHWNLEQQVLFTSKNVDYIQIPEFALHSRAYWLGALSKGVLKTQIGVDVDWRSAYYSNGYLPLSQDFYVQNNIKNFAYPLVDVFANFNIKMVDLFIKVGHANQLQGRPGYLASAYYPSKGFTFVFGVKWRFFD